LASAPLGENSLGLLYMRMGRAERSPNILTKAFEADPFNVRVSNALKVLHHLEKICSMKTDHFELATIPLTTSTWSVIAKYLEEISYTELTKKFQLPAQGQDSDRGF